jgi:4'-phosphopantetheinyl transferase
MWRQRAQHKTCIPGAPKYFITMVRPRGDFRPPRRSMPPESVLAELRGLCGGLAGASIQVPAVVSTSAQVVKPEAPNSGVLRWLVDISAWHPKETEWQLLLRMITEEEATKVMRFIREEDRIRALVSRLLQRRACFESTGVPYASVRIERTKGSKPFMANKPPASAPGMRVAPNWNFNISHEGKYVVLAAEPKVVVGVDVAEPFDQRSGINSMKGGMEEHLRIFRDQLTESEVKRITRYRPDEVKMEHAFRQFWSLKEAYTKGRGEGIGFEFSRAEFSIGEQKPQGLAAQPVQSATVRVDKAPPSSTWSFFMQPLEAEHWISVARGTPKDVVDAHGKFRKTFKLTLTARELQEELSRPEPPFEAKLIADLGPDDVRGEYERHAGSRPR